MENKEYYWSLVLESGWVQAGIWTIDDKKAEVVSFSETVAWSGESEDEMLTSVDRVLSQAIEDFNEEETEPQKTVFGVAPTWVDEGTIKKEYLGKIRVICSKLSLKPSGFVVLPEAIAHEVKLSDGSPLTGIVIGVSKGVIDISVFKLGNLLGTVNVGRSVSIPEDVVEGLTRFGLSEHFPSRIILYNGDNSELENFRQEILAIDWGKYANIRFLHSPQVEIVDDRRRILAVSLAGASEIGEIDGVKMQDREKVDQVNDNNLNQGDELTAGDVGFVLGEDVAEMSQNQEEAVRNEEKQEFVVRGEGIVEKKFNLRNLIKKLPLSKIRVPKRRGRESLVAAKLPSGPKKYVVGVGVAFVLLVVGIGGFWWYVPKAEVVLYVAPKNLEETTYVVLDEAATEFDMEDLIIPAETARVEISGNKTLAASGTKLIGDRASGTVTIRNGTSSDITVSSSTKFVGPNDLVFYIDEDVEVEAASSPSSPGSVDVSVTAGDIGAEYNLAEGESFVVGNYPKSEVDGVAKGDLSGGSSREVQAVAQKDLNNLYDLLIEELTKKASDQLNEQIASSDVFVEGAVRTDVIREDYTHSAGEEANEVGLEMSVEAVGLTISEEIVSKLARSVFEGQVPEGFTLRDEQIKANFELEGEYDGQWDFTVSFRANLLPEISPDDVSRKISGKYPAYAEEYLSTIAGFRRAEISITPKLPSKLAIIPRVLNHISVEVVSDK